ncbi:MFS transporter [Anaerotardibacter muris]|uniref:MFS transporter n=1 Tax=Anaerotardibacter muris TaxID=2941505 RepID=UPI00203C9BE0|nr:MFS transporter [Anaerotardibacter muris]
MAKQPSDTDVKPRHAKAALLIVVALGIVFTASVLRGPLTSVGALAAPIQDGLGLSSAMMGMVTTLPLLAFAASALLLSEFANRFGKSRVLAVACISIAVGLLWRSDGTVFGLFAGTIFAGIGISAGNILLPAVVRQRFPLHVGIMTALYTTTMSLFAGGAAGVSSMLAETSQDWQAILMMLLPFAIIAALLWIVARPLAQRSDTAKPSSNKRSGGAAPLAPHLIKSPVTWWITALFGVQSVLFYCCVAWLPAILASSGVNAETITLCVALFPIVGIPCTLFVPPLAQRMKRQRALGAIIGIICVIGAAALLFIDSDTAAIVATSIIGFALGAPFCLCMYYFGVRTEDPNDAAKLSSISQTFGYLMAAFGPVLLGFLVDVTGSWLVSLLVMLVLSLILVVCGWKAGTGTIPAAQDHLRREDPHESSAH